MPHRTPQEVSNSEMSGASKLSVPDRPLSGAHDMSTNAVSNRTRWRSSTTMLQISQSKEQTCVVSRSQVNLRLWQAPKVMAGEVALFRPILRYCILCSNSASRWRRIVVNARRTRSRAVIGLGYFSHGADSGIGTHGNRRCQQQDHCQEKQQPTPPASMLVLKVTSHYRTPVASSARRVSTRARWLR